MKKKNPFLIKDDIPYTPVHYQFIKGAIKEKEEREYYRNRVSIGLYQTDKAMTYSHYNPISKILDESI